MDRRVFGEGICPLNSNEIVVLTWQNNIVYLLDHASLKLKSEVPLFDGAKEGWGVTNFVNPGKKNYGLYVSDGTDQIQIIDGDSFGNIGTLYVKDEYGRAVKNINELDYARGLIWANIWYSNDIIAIDPKDGKVVKRYNMLSLKKAETSY